MAYDLIGFTNNNPPAINAANLNKMDNKIFDNDSNISVLKVATTDTYNALASNLFGNTIDGLPCIINSSLNWGTVDSGKHYCIPVVAGDKIYIQANAAKYCYYAFLADHEYLDGEAANIVDGVRHSIANNSAGNLVIPSGCKFLYILKETSGMDYAPLSIMVNGVEWLNGINSRINDILSGNKNILYFTDTTDRTVNGLNISFASDGTISVKGTATATTYIYLRGTTSGAVENIPSGTYTITRWTLSGNGNIRFAYRVGDTTTNLISSASTNKISVTHTFADGTGVFLSIGNTNTVNGVFRFQIEAGNIGTEYSPATGKYPSDDYARMKAVESGKNLKYRYTTIEETQGATECVQVILNRFLRFDIAHSVVAETHCDVWRILSLNAVSDNNLLLKKLTSNGEWECALRLSNRDDFSGGYLHGDEVQTSIAFFADGVLDTEITDHTDFEETKEFRIIRTSNLLDPADHTTVIAEHGVEYIFTEDGLTINQSVKWKINDTLNKCYLAMFPASKSNFFKYYSNNEFEARALTQSSYSIEESKANNMSIFGDYYLADFGVEKYPTGLTGGDALLITDNDGKSYNKCYYRVCNGGQITSDTLWQTTTKYKIRKLNDMSIGE